MRMRFPARMRTDTGELVFSVELRVVKSVMPSAKLLERVRHFPNEHRKRLAPARKELDPSELGSEQVGRYCCCPIESRIQRNCSCDVKSGLRIASHIVLTSLGQPNRQTLGHDAR